MNENVKLIGTVIFELALLASAVALGNAIYTHTQVGTDKKALGISVGIGIVSGFILAKYLKK
jgi:hypothetical protein